MTTDQRIVDGIRAALGSDPRIHNAPEVAVAERAGTVTLRGTVRSMHQRRSVVEIVRSVAGVEDVEDLLRVDPRDHWYEDELRGTALQALISSEGVTADRIEVKAGQGWLTLTGEVKNQSESDAAFAAVSELPGVGGITNEIKVITAGLDG